MYEVDIDVIARTGAKAVLNLQMPEESKDREVDTEMLEKEYRSKGINTFLNVPINDGNETMLI